MTINDSITTENNFCVQCGAPLNINSRFCHNCGAKQTIEDINWVETKWALLKQCALFYGVNILSCALVNFIDAFQTFSWLIFFEIVLCGTSVYFFATNWSGNKKLLIWKSFSWQKLAAYGALAMGSSFLVHYLTGWLNVVIFSKNEQYFLFLKGNFYAEVLLIFFTAIIPALFEELGFRGFLLENLLKVADKQQAVYISAFLFAILHMSFISLIWLIPFALFLGFVRLKENTLWYGIFFHFLFNLTACLFELL